MPTVDSLRGSAHGMTCNKCGDSLIAPECSEYFSEERLVLNLWSCTTCGNRFETEAFASADIRSKFDQKILEELLAA